MIGVYATAYTPQNKLAASTVLPKNFTLVSESGQVAAITEAYYYAENNQVKFIVETKNAGVQELWNLASTGVLDTEGNAANAAGELTLFRETDISYGSVQVSAVTFLEDGVPTVDVVNKSGLVAVIRISNTTGKAVSGKVRLFDGNSVVAERNCTIESESFEELSIDISEHSFKNEARVEFSVS